MSVTRQATSQCSRAIRLSISQKAARRHGTSHRSTYPTSSNCKWAPILSTRSFSTSTKRYQPVKPYFVTTPIFYVNASPHIGHLHTLVLTDVLARYARLKEPDRPVLFCTGTDEHGLKVQQAAAKNGVPALEFCDAVSQRFRNLASKANISATTFIRTTEQRHFSAVEHFWNKLVNAGDVYKGTHAGWYSISDESFFAATQVVEKEGKMISIETGNEVVWEEEVNWKFRLGKWKEPLKEWAENPNSIQPEPYRLEVIRQLDNLEDLSISRPNSRVKWGVPVPNDPDQTIYVWVDALINYITVLGYPKSIEGWPADVQVVGKDIIKFHAIHWPALLLSAGMKPPTTVLAHAHWTMAKSKMSKSKGNVVDPLEAMDKWGVDGVRWFLMRAGGSLPDDADYSEEQMRVQYNLLADQVGNLLSRISAPRILSRIRSGPLTAEERDSELDKFMTSLHYDFTSKMENYQITKACEGIMDLIGAANRLFTQLQPWKTEDSTQAVFYAYEALRMSGILLQAIIPSKSSELLDRLGVSDSPADRSLEAAKWDSEATSDPNHIVKSIEKGKSSHTGHLFPQVRD